MFKGFIVVGVALGVGYTQGYLKGQEHTKELAALLQDLRDSEETKQFLVELREALRAAGEAAAAAKTEDVDGGDEEDVDGDVVTPVITPVPDQSA